MEVFSRTPPPLKPQSFIKTLILCSLFSSFHLPNIWKNTKTAFIYILQVLGSRGSLPPSPYDLKGLFVLQYVWSSVVSSLPLNH